MELQPAFYNIALALAVALLGLFTKSLVALVNHRRRMRDLVCSAITPSDCQADHFLSLNHHGVLSLETYVSWARLPLPSHLVPIHIIFRTGSVNSTLNCLLFSTSTLGDRFLYPRSPSNADLPSGLWPRQCSLSLILLPPLR